MESIIREYVLKHFWTVYSAPKGFDMQLSDCDLNISNKALNYIKKKETSDIPIGLFQSNGRDIAVFWPRIDTDQLFDIKDSKLSPSFDFIASSFILLSGYHEFHEQGDESRMDVQNSILYKLKMHRFPVVNYYFHEFKLALEKHYQIELAFKHPKARIFLSHDIDRTKSGWKEGGMYALKNGAIFKVIGAIWAKLIAKDPWDNLAYIAELEEKHSMRSCFYFLPEKSKENADYDIGLEPYPSLMKKLDKQGHEVGLHGSLGSHQDVELLKSNSDKVFPRPISNRFHFLNFNYKHTIQVLEKSKIKTDSSLGFYNEIGFRNGISHPFYLFDHVNFKASDVLEIPLNCMDTSFRKSTYLGSSAQEAIELIEELAQEVEKFNGCLGILWHNNYVSDYKFETWKRVYIELLEKYSNRFLCRTPSQMWHELKKES